MSIDKLTSQLHRLVLVSDNLGRRVNLLLALLGHAAAQAENQMERRLLLYIIVRESTTILKLLTCKDQTLLIRRDTLLILDLGLHVVDRVTRLNIQRDGLARKSLVRGWGNNVCKKSNKGRNVKILTCIVLPSRRSALWQAGKAPAVKMILNNHLTLVIGVDKMTNKFFASKNDEMCCVRRFLLLVVNRGPPMSSSYNPASGGAPMTRQSMGGAGGGSDSKRSTFGGAKYGEFNFSFLKKM